VEVILPPSIIQESRRLHLFISRREEEEEGREARWSISDFNPADHTCPSYLCLGRTSASALRIQLNSTQLSWTLESQANIAPDIQSHNPFTFHVSTYTLASCRVIGFFCLRHLPLRRDRFPSLRPSILSAVSISIPLRSVPFKRFLPFPSLFFCGFSVSPNLLSSYTVVNCSLLYHFLKNLTYFHFSVYHFSWILFRELLATWGSVVLFFFSLSFVSFTLFAFYSHTAIQRPSVHFCW